MKKIKHLLSSRKLFAAVLTIALLASLIPLGIVLGNNAGAINPDYVENGYGVNEDNNTVEPETIVPGQVWTDKVVTSVAASPFDGVFNVQLKAVGGEISTTTSQAADIVFVLDRSTSMRNEDYNLMVEAVNKSIETIMESNTANKVAVVCFGSTANTLLGLGRYTSTNDMYLTYGSSTLAVSGTVSVESGSGGAIGSSIKTSDTNYTNIQAGLISAYNILNAAADSNMPAIVLMSDGGASKYTKNFNTLDISNASSWSQSTDYNDDDQFAHTAAYYTIRTANNIKSLLGAGSIYTIGYNLGRNNKVATATLNPIPANITATAALLWDWQNTLSEQLGTGNFQYNNDYYTGSNTSGLTTAMLSAVGEIIDSSSPILGDLVFTDNIGAGFGFITETDNTIAFHFDGDTADRYAVKHATENRYEYTDPDNNISVVFDAGVPMQVRYTIPAAALRLAAYDDNNNICNVDTFNTLDFKVRLSDSVTSTTDTYYTNNGCNAVFSPTLSNDFYYNTIPDTEENVGSAVTKTYERITTPSTSSVPWECQYDNELGDSNIDDITIDGVKYDGPHTGPGGDFAEYSLVRTGASNNSWTVTFKPKGANQPTYVISFTAQSGDDDFDANSDIAFQYRYRNKSNDGLAYRVLCDVRYLSIGGVSIHTDNYKLTYTGATDSSTKNVTIVVDDGLKKGTYTFTYTFVDPGSNDRQWAVYTYNPASKTASTTVWKDAGDDTNIPDPSMPSGYTGSQSVTINGETYTGDITGTANNWSLTGSKPAATAGNTVYFTITCNGTDGDTLTVVTQEKNFIAEHKEPDQTSGNIDGEVKQTLTETGWIKLAHADGSLRVEKQVTNYDPNSTEQFSFTVGLGDAAATAAVYTYDPSDDTYDKTDLDTNMSSYSFSLGDNDYAVFTGLAHGSSYTVTEAINSAFDTTISSSNTTVTANANGVFQGAIIGGPTTNKVTFTNAYKVGALTIGKTVLQDEEIVDEPELTRAAVTLPGYTFQVVFTLPNGITYQDISYDDSLVTKDTDSLTFTFSLGNGEELTLGNIPDGTHFTVTETSSDDAVVYYSVNSSDLTAGKVAQGNIASAEDEDSVQFTNNYLTPSPLTITKTVTETSDYPLAPDSFTFEIFFYNIDQEKLNAEVDAKATYDIAQNNLNTALSTLQNDTNALITALGDGYDADSAMTAAEQAAALLAQAEADYNDAVAAAAAAHPDEDPPYDTNADPDVIAAKGVWDSLKSALLPLLAASETSYNAVFAPGGLQELRDAASDTYELAKAEVVEVPYVLSTDEIPLNPELTPVTGDGNEGHYTFTLAASGSIAFADLPIGLYYRVTETTTGAKTTTITNSQKVDDNLDLTTEGQIVWNFDDVAQDDDNAIFIAYANDYRISLGSLTLTKEFDDSTAPWKLPSEGNFTFDITIGETLYDNVGLNYNNGHSVTYNGLLPGTTYTIVETTSGTYTTNAPFSGTIQASGQWGTEDVTLECVNTYDLPIDVTKSVDQANVTTGTTVTYTGSVTYENPYAVTSVTLTDGMFSAIPDSFVVSDLGSAVLDVADWDNNTETDDSAYVWSTAHDQLVIHLQGQDMGEEQSFTDTNTITFTYQVKFNTAGTYPNTVTADVAYYYPQYQYAVRAFAVDEQVPVYVYSDSATASVTVTDPYTPPPYNPPPVIITSDPEYGTLTVVKNVTGENAPTDESFSIMVQFNGTLNTILYNGTTNPDGLYTLSLAAGQSGTFTNIPLNTSFTVTEALTDGQSDSGWMAPAEDIEGTITNTTPVTVSVNNVYDVGLLGDVDVDEELEPETETGVAGDAEKDDILPQTGGIAFSTLLAFIGLALIAIGGAVFMAMRRKFVGKSKSK